MFNNMYPYNLEISNETALYQLKNGRYQTIKDCDIDSVMIGYKYILLENAIADYFRSLDIERVTYKPAVIWSRRANIEHTNYQAMTVNHHFDSSKIRDLDLSGKQFLLMENRYLFASPELKVALESSVFQFEFSEGLSRFG